MIILDKEHIKVDIKSSIDAKTKIVWFQLSFFQEREQQWQTKVFRFDREVADKIVEFIQKDYANRRTAIFKRKL